MTENKETKMEEKIEDKKKIEKTEDKKEQTKETPGNQISNPKMLWNM